jgi:hypothetical protein
MVELCQKDKKPGENPLPCLSQHIDEFSEPCQNWIREAEAASAKGPKAGGAATTGTAKPATPSAPPKAPTAAD